MSDFNSKMKHFDIRLSIKYYTNVKSDSSSKEILTMVDPLEDNIYKYRSLNRNHDKSSSEKATNSHMKPSFK